MRRFYASCLFSLPIYGLLTGLLTVRCQAQSGDGKDIRLPGEGVSSVAGDSLALRAGYAGAVKMYHASMAPESGLYRGSQYIDYAFAIKEGHPFFGDDHFHKGSVFYDGVLYENRSLIYDLVKGQVVLNDPFNIYKLYLVNERLDYFTIEGHLFIPQRDSLDPSSPTRGFYELLYGVYSGESRGPGAEQPGQEPGQQGAGLPGLGAGQQGGGLQGPGVERGAAMAEGQGASAGKPGKLPVSLLKKEKKSVQEDFSSTEGVRRYIVYSVSYYLRIGSAYYAVNNKKSLSHALKDRARDARKFIRTNGLSVRKDKENTLIKVAAWYESHHP